MTETLGGHGAVHEQLLWLAVLAVFAASVVGLFLLYRRVTGRVELERAEAVLADEIDALEPKQRRAVTDR